MKKKIQLLYKVFVNKIINDPASGKKPLLGEDQIYDGATETDKT